MLSVAGVAGLIGWGYLEPKLQARKEQRLLEEAAEKEKAEQKRAVEEEKARQQQVADELAKMKADL